MAGNRRSARLQKAPPEHRTIVDPVAIERAASAARRRAQAAAVGSPLPQATTQNRGRGARGGRRGRGGRGAQGGRGATGGGRGARGGRGGRGGTAAPGPSVPTSTPLPNSPPLPSSPPLPTGYVNNPATPDVPTSTTEQVTTPSGPNATAPSASVERNGTSQQPDEAISRPLAEGENAAHSTPTRISPASRPGPNASSPTGARGTTPGPSRQQAGRANLADSEAAQDLTAENFCSKLAALLENWRRQAADDEIGPIDDPVTANIGLADTTIWRAIAAVTMASQVRVIMPRFSLFDPIAVRAGLLAPDRPMQTAVDPGNEGLLIRTDGTDGMLHHSLYFLKKIGDSSFELRSYDSARGDWHRRDNQEKGAEFRQALTALAWDRRNEGLVVEPRVRQSEPAARQVKGWECGIYVILYAWAIALGLEDSLATFTGITRQADFVNGAVELINLSLQGYCSSETIEAFLKCFSIVETTATIPYVRGFDNTLAFRTDHVLRQYIAKRRIEDDLHDMGYDELPPIYEMVMMIEDSNPEFASSLAERTAEELMVEYTKASSLQDASPEPRPPVAEAGQSTHSRSSGSGQGRQSTPRKRHHEGGIEPESPKRRKEDDSVQTSGKSTPDRDTAAANDADDRAPHIASDEVRSAAGHGGDSSRLSSITPGNNKQSSSSRGDTPRKDGHDNDTAPKREPVSGGSAAAVDTDASNRTPSNGSGIAHDESSTNHAPAQPTTTPSALPSDVLLSNLEFAPHTPTPPNASPPLARYDTLANDLPLGADDDLFGDDEDLYTSTPRPRPSLQLESQLRSPGGLALPPPTPRNTAPSPQLSEGFEPTRNSEDSWDQNFEDSDPGLGEQDSDDEEEGEGEEGIAALLQSHGVDIEVNGEARIAENDDEDEEEDEEQLEQY